MKRLTTNKRTKDMSMVELAYNSCYADENHNARYRNYGLDIDSREYARSLIKDVCGEDLSNMSDEEFDEYILEMFWYGTDEPEGLIALFYRNLWAMADLREHLKYYEDLDEQGKLVKLPCNVGDMVYVILSSDCSSYAEAEVRDFVHFTSCGFCIVVTSKCFDKQNIPFAEFGKTVFLTKSEAEAKLKELAGKKMTNADKIRNMTDEELIEFIVGLNNRCLAGIGECNCSKSTMTCDEICEKNHKMASIRSRTGADMDGLVIKRKWLDLILSGQKTLEIRGHDTHKLNEPIYLLESGTHRIVAECVIDSTYPISCSDWSEERANHCVDISYSELKKRYKNPYAWVLSYVKPINSTLYYRHPKGAVIWVKNVKLLEVRDDRE